MQDRLRSNQKVFAELEADLVCGDGPWVYAEGAAWDRDPYQVQDEYDWHNDRWLVGTGPQPLEDEGDVMPVIDEDLAASLLGFLGNVSSAAPPRM